MDDQRNRKNDEGMRKSFFLRRLDERVIEYKWQLNNIRLISLDNSYRGIRKILVNFGTILGNCYLTQKMLFKRSLNICVRLLIVHYKNVNFLHRGRKAILFLCRKF